MSMTSSFSSASCLRFTGAEQDHLVLPLIIALPLEQGHTAVELAVDGRGDGLILLRDDERDLGIIHAVDDAVERHGGDDHGNDAVERVVEVAVDYACDDGNGQVHAEDDLADGEIAEFQLHQARDDVDAAVEALPRNTRPRLTPMNTPPNRAATSGSTAGTGRMRANRSRKTDVSTVL